MLGYLRSGGWLTASTCLEIAKRYRRLLEKVLIPNPTEDGELCAFQRREFFLTEVRDAIGGVERTMSGVSGER
jgi:hypothetical protein